MSIIDILRLIRKHLVVLLFTPLFLAAIVFYLTRNPTFSYSSETSLYTGIASGTSIEMDKSFSLFANSTAFDNLINVIKSRKTQQEVAIRLLAQHLMLQKSDPRYISSAHFDELRKITPENIQLLAVKSNHPRPGANVNLLPNIQNLKEQPITSGEAKNSDQLVDTTSFSFSKLDTTSEKVNTLPPSINREAYEQTVKNLEDYMASNDTNFIYKLLYFNHPHYSIKAISSVNAQRIGSSDLVKLKYDADDPGICQQTLAILTEVCIKNYKQTKENRSNDVVKYFEYQLKQAATRLKIGEDKLLKFNVDNNIINYYEQSKAVANVKEDLDIEYNNKRIKIAGNKTVIKRIEEKLGTQKQIQLKSESIIEKRNRLNLINSKIATNEIISNKSTNNEEQLVKLKTEAEDIKDELRNSVSDLYSYNNSTEGLPINNLLNEWINNVITYEDTRAGIEVLGERIKEFQKQYEIYAPAGANLKRIEREISVSEQEFLEILHGLNLANLKVQDAELSSTIKTTDAPFYPLAPNPTKRKFLIISAGLVGFVLVAFMILVLEYFDDTLNNPERASKTTTLKTIGIFPKVFLKVEELNFPFVANRLLEMLIQQIEVLTQYKTEQKKPCVLLFISSLNNEGKTIIAGNIALKLKKQGNNVLFLTYRKASILPENSNQIGYVVTTPVSPQTGEGLKRNHFSFFSLMMGYPDNRIDYSSPFLVKPDTYLDSNEFVEFDASGNYFSTESFHDLINKEHASMGDPDYVILELPSILNYSYPSKLVESADLTLLVCRANRVWSKADQGVLNTLRKMTRQEPVVVLNGVEFQVIETVLGDLPKKRSRIRRFLKSVARFQFKPKYQV